MAKFPKVTRAKLLRALRAFEDFRQKVPNGYPVLEVETFMQDEKSDEPDLVKVSVRFEYPNYEWLAREIYGSAELKDGAGAFRAPTGLIRDEIQRMFKDGVVALEHQEVSFSTTNKTNGEEYRIDPGKLFQEDLRDYKTKIVLTTKEKSLFEYWKSSFPENATAWLALLVSIIALVVSTFR